MENSMISYLLIYQLTIEYGGLRIKDISDCISSSYDKSEISVIKISEKQENI